MNRAFMEDHQYAADLYRDEIGSVEDLWNRAFAEGFGNSRSRRVFSGLAASRSPTGGIPNHASSANHRVFR
jgi:hypothetical protein